MYVYIYIYIFVRLLFLLLSARKFHKVPTINIGSRQKGRLRHKSIIDVGYSFLEIKKAIDKTTNKRFRKKLSKMKYKFGNGDSCKKIEKIILKKHRLNKGNVK